MPRKKRDISQALLDAIQNKLSITRDGLNKKIQATKKKYNLDSDEVAVCLICYEDKVRISPENPKYFDTKKGYAVPQWAIEQAYRIQTSIGVATTPSTRQTLSKPSTPGEKLPPIVKVPSDPILPEEKIKQAEKMASEVYPLFFVLENSIRELIIRVMENAYPGKDWWNEPGVIPDSGDTRVKSDVERLMKDEEEKPWPGRRAKGTPPIYYTYLWHLREIINHEPNWKHFKPILKKPKFIDVTIDEISTCRNNIMHCNPLRPSDIDVVKHRLKQWHRQLQDAINSKVMPERKS